MNNEFELRMNCIPIIYMDNLITEYIERFITNPRHPTHPTATLIKNAALGAFRVTDSIFYTNKPEYSGQRCIYDYFLQIKILDKCKQYDKKC